MENFPTAIMDGSDILRPLTEEELQELLKLYVQKYGGDNFQYLLIYSQCKWNRKLNEMNINKNDKRWLSFRRDFYTHVKGDFRKYGTYVCLHQDLVSTLNISDGIGI